MIGTIDPSHIDTTYLPKVVVDMGKRSLIELLNAELNNLRFEVKFSFPKVKRTLLAGEFTALT